MYHMDLHTDNVFQNFYRRVQIDQLDNVSNLHTDGVSYLLHVVLPCYGAPVNSFGGGHSSCIEAGGICEMPPGVSNILSLTEALSSPGER